MCPPFLFMLYASAGTSAAPGKPVTGILATGAIPDVTHSTDDAAKPAHPIRPVTGSIVDIPSSIRDPMPRGSGEIAQTMPSWLTLPFADLDVQRIPLGPFDTRLWWLLIGLIVALVFTVQAVETAVEGAWPNQRRPSKLVPRARWAQRTWGLVSIAVLAGALLIVGIVAILIWRSPHQPDGLTLGAWLLGIGWAMFLLFSLDVLGLGKFMNALGWLGPIAIFAILIVADILLFAALREILPDWETLRTGIEDGLRSILPFVE